MNFIGFIALLLSTIYYGFLLIFGYYLVYFWLDQFMYFLNMKMDADIADMEELAIEREKEFKAWLDGLTPEQIHELLNKLGLDD